MSPRHVQPTVRRNVFAPLDGGDRVEAVERRLTDAIRTGMLIDGEQLPSEQELAAQLGVATVTLREALAGLRRRGLVRTRRGRGGGTFVHVDVETRRAHLRERLRELSVDDLRDVGDHHSAIAVGTAQLAAERASAGDVATLRRHLDALAAADGEHARHAADWRFHVELAAAAQSRRLAEASAELQVDAGTMLWFVARPDLDAALADHGAILAAVEAGDAAAAGRLAAAHVERETHALIAARLALVAEPEPAPAAARAPALAGAAAAPAGGGGAGAEAGGIADRRAACEALLRPLHAAVEELFAGIAALHDATLALRRDAAAAGRGLRRADLAPLRARIHALLESDPVAIYGTGVVFAPDVLEDAPRWLEWWWRPVDRPVPLETVLDPGDSRYYDYEQAIWFAAPRDTGERWVAGPFVDYSGTDRHIFNLALPLRDEAGFLGVAGIDVTASRMEELAAPGLRAVPGDAALLNRNGRVIASNTIRWLPGTICDAVAAEELDAGDGAAWSERPDGTALLRSPSLRWAVVTRPPA